MRRKVVRVSKQPAATIPGLINVISGPSVVSVQITTLFQGEISILLRKWRMPDAAPRRASREKGRLLSLSFSLLEDSANSMPKRKLVLGVVEHGSAFGILRGLPGTGRAFPAQ